MVKIEFEIWFCKKNDLEGFGIEKILEGLGFFL